MSPTSTATAVAGIIIPDSRLAKEAAEILRADGNDLLWNHSHRVYLFGALLAERAGKHYDPELSYVAALFHDIGLIHKYSTQTERFEVDGANARGSSSSNTGSHRTRSRSSGTRSRSTRRSGSRSSRKPKSI